MITYTEALQKITLLPRVDATEDLLLVEAGGRVLARDVMAVVPSPPFTNSAMDGIAIRHADGAGPFLVSGTILAGPVNASTIPEYKQASCVRIMTGGCLPSWADTVVPVENTTTLENGQVKVNDLPAVGMHVRREGEDFAKGSIGLSAGMLIGPERIMAAAALGASRVSVYRQPRLVLASTGDELQDPGTVLAPGAVFNSSRLMLKASVAKLGLPLVANLDVPDDHAIARSILEKVFAGGPDQHVLLVSTGAVSAGEKDFIPQVAKEMGFEALFHKVLIRPGRPVFLARKDSAVWIGLPGNPVSTSVGWHFFVRPVLARMSGVPLPPKIPVVLGSDVKKAPDLRCFYRAHIEDGKATVFDRQGSGEYRASVMANAYVELPEAGSLVPSGTRVMATLV